MRAGMLAFSLGVLGLQLLPQLPGADARVVLLALSALIRTG